MIRSHTVQEFSSYNVIIRFEHSGRFSVARVDKRWTMRYNGDEVKIMEDYLNDNVVISEEVMKMALEELEAD